MRQEPHHRHSLRLKDYDYSQAGAYFLTIVTHHRQAIFGQISDGKMILNEMGQIVQEEWERSGSLRRELQLDVFVIMPNHIHGVVLITNSDVGATGRSPSPGPSRQSLGAFVAGFKSAVTSRVNALRRIPGMSIWQRNYYEHVIRNEESLHRIREYILTNPLRWEVDPENPAAIAPEAADIWRTGTSSAQGDQPVAPTEYALTSRQNGRDT